MSFGELTKQLEVYKKEYPDIYSWDVYVEVLSTGDLNDKWGQNRKNPSSWKIIEYSPDGDMYRDYYIDIAGGIGIDHVHRAILICINY